MNNRIGAQSGCNSCVERADIFDCLCQSELANIDEKRIEINFKAGELIFKQGTPNLHFLCLTSGMVKLYIEGFDSKNLILGIVKPIEYILGPGIYVDSKHHYSAMAIEDSTACLVETSVFKNLIRTNPDFAEAFIRKVSLLSIMNFEQVISLTQKQMPGRIADVIIYLKDRVYESNPFTTTLSRQDLADMSGMSKESAIRILKEFKDEDIIRVDGNHIEVINEEQLHKISQTG
ncbi:MAG: Crp/Fnr family transcriptional regulator [Bacteroidales bacterium]|nr:Crp/Fnr family transcriptional regulator [Bacteroidales bacterium]